jgi:hypothetical protein
MRGKNRCAEVVQAHVGAPCLWGREEQMLWEWFSTFSLRNSSQNSAGPQLGAFIGLLVTFSFSILIK